MQGVCAERYAPSAESPGLRANSKKQQAEGSWQLAESKEQGANSKEQSAESSWQIAAGRRQGSKSKEQGAAGREQRAKRRAQRAEWKKGCRELGAGGMCRAQCAKRQALCFR